MKRVYLVGLLVIAISLFPVSSALAQIHVPPPPPLNVPTTAEIGGTGQPPIVEWAWVLPDMNVATFDPAFDASTQESADPATVEYLSPWDDDPSRAPDPTLIPASRNMMQVAPNPDDDPSNRQIAYWMALEEPNGIANLGIPYVRVFHPDGTEKYKLHAIRMECSAVGTVNAAGAPATHTAVVEAALRTGQMTLAERNELIERCYKLEKAVYVAVGDLSKHQPAGEYRVETTGVDVQGNLTTLTNWFDVLSIVALRIDFSALNFGYIVPNTPSWLSGDRVFGTGGPTVMNVGNDPMHVRLAFSRMIGVAQNNRIEVFDARLATESLPPFNAEVPVGTLNWQCFPNTTLGANVFAQLDLSIHPGYLPSDVYGGLFYIAGIHECPTVP